MASRLVELFPPTFFNFNDLGHDGGSEKVVYLTIAQRINVADYDQAKLIVRVYQNDIADSNDKLTVAVNADPYTPDAPGALWRVADGEAALLSVDVLGGAGGTDSGTALYDSVSGGLGNLVKILVAATRGTGSSATNDIEAWLDASLALKSGS